MRMGFRTWQEATEKWPAQCETGVCKVCGKEGHGVPLFFKSKKYGKKYGGSGQHKKAHLCPEHYDEIGLADYDEHYVEQAKRGILI